MSRSYPDLVAVPSLAQWQGLSFFSRVGSLLRHEGRLAYRFIKRDLPVAHYASMAFLVSAVIASQVPPLQAARAVLTGAIYFFLYLYSFCLGNQIAGVEEDRVNKPDRPIASGQISLPAATARWALMNFLFPSYAAWAGGWALARWALAWQLLSISYNFFRLDKNWFTKNCIFISLGGIFQVAAAWQIVAPISEQAWVWIVVVSVLFGVSLQLQDFRDVEGDKLLKRRTLPMVIGEDWARWLTGLFIAVVMPVCIHWVLFGLGHQPLWVRGAEALQAVLCVWVGARAIVLRTPADDHRTYMMHTYWFMCIFLTAGFVLQSQV